MPLIASCANPRDCGGKLVIAAKNMHIHSSEGPIGPTATDSIWDRSNSSAMEKPGCAELNSAATTQNSKLMMSSGAIPAMRSNCWIFRYFGPTHPLSRMKPE